MKKFRNLRMTLFDSTNANFKLAVEAQFTSGSEQTGYRDRVYVTERQSGILSSNIYITLAYKSDDAEPLYTSYPQLFRLRETFKKVIDNGLLDGSAFMTSDSGLIVRPDHEEPFVLSNIGKDNNWISIRYAVASLTNENVSETVPAVSIELSKNNHYASVLTVEEFLTVYTILCDINLPALQCMMSLAYLDTPQFSQNQNSQVYYNQNQMMPQQGMYQPAPMNNGYNPQGQNMPNQNWQYQNNNRPAPRYNNYRQPSAPPVNSYRTAGPNPNQSTVVTNRENTQPTQAPVRDANKPVLNLKAVEDTPIDNVSFDDSEALNSLFEED